MSEKIILHLCADIGSDSMPYKLAGYDVRCIGKDIGVENYHPPANVYGVIANPPCTMFSAARTNAKKPRDLREGMHLVKECLRIIWEIQYNFVNRSCPLKFWYIENPATGMLKYFLGKPTFEYSPHEFGENYQKRTALWGFFNLPKKPLFASIKKQSWEEFSGSKFADRMHKRSACSQKFAQAFYEANP